MSQAPISVLHMIDSLAIGGAERMAVNIANHMPFDEFDVHLCTTRREGPLVSLIGAQVKRLSLQRSGRFDRQAVRRLIAYNQENRIQILHAHSTSLFLATIASFFPPYPSVIWHVHSGSYETRKRRILSYRLAALRLRGVIAVNQQLVDWARRRVKVAQDRVWYVSNFVEMADHVQQRGDLPGVPGSRIVCVANLREQKDHFTLVRAMEQVVREVPSAHLLLIGSLKAADYVNQVRAAIGASHLDAYISIMGEQENVPAILQACDIGVLSSSSEGLPLVLLEYGAAHLAAVATQVGQCAEVLEGGHAGMLVPPKSPDQLAQAIIDLLQSPEKRTRLGEQFHARVQQKYSIDAAINQIARIYQIVLRLPVKDKAMTFPTEFLS